MAVWQSGIADVTRCLFVHRIELKEISIQFA